MGEWPRRCRVAQPRLFSTPPLSQARISMNCSTKILLGASLIALSACASSGAPGAASGATPAVEASSGGMAESAAPAPSASPTVTAAAASFTDDQADRGREVFRSQCTECHSSSEFSDSQFKFKWSRRHAGSLYQMIQTQMPETAPGSLTEDEAVDIVSYILRMNGFEPGSAELSSDRGVLDGISLSSIRN